MHYLKSGSICFILKFKQNLCCGEFKQTSPLLLLHLLLDLVSIGRYLTQNTYVNVEHSVMYSHLEVLCKKVRYSGYQHTMILLSHSRWILVCLYCKQHCRQKDKLQMCFSLCFSKVQVHVQDYRKLGSICMSLGKANVKAYCNITVIHLREFHM